MRFFLHCLFERLHVLVAALLSNDVLRFPFEEDSVVNRPRSYPSCDVEGTVCVLETLSDCSQPRRIGARHTKEFNNRIES